jgi:D-alanyl-D-alanine dipeptidase
MRSAAALAILALAACESATPTAPTAPAELAAAAAPAAVIARDAFAFEDAGAVIPGLVVEMRYFGSENFVGRRIAGYEAPICLLTQEAVRSLAAVQERLNSLGLGLKVFDCYRPKRAVDDFVRWARTPTDQGRKADFYPNVDKWRLFELGYIAERSGHSRGSTLDVTMVNMRTGAEVDMGSPYDLFDPVSWPASTAVSRAAQANRMLLQDTMIKAGFRPLKEEWWHFTLEDEPYPETYFDFAVK